MIKDTLVKISGRTWVLKYVLVKSYVLRTFGVGKSLV